ncbi:TipJ family phage tail tip protein [Yersinia enterocolitica]|uniref:TipJ family phage tail tip protein n=1 Tax=Yersinia enterocolitica TaxID=630 RepID=UPI003F42BAEC
MARKQIKGRKGGSSNATTPVESPDSIQSTAKAKILLALGEGEFAGGLDGTNIYLDGTPIKNPDGSSNFTGVTWEYRAGTQAQDYIQGMPNVENEITVNTELKSDTPWVRSVTNTQLSAVRVRFGWPSLQRQADNGDVGGYRIEYAIDVSTDGGAYSTLLNTAIDGKTTTLYERSHRINLPKATTGWQIRSRRITANANSGRIADRMNTEAISEVIDAKLRYPNTALLYIEFDATQFQNIPAISCEPKGRVIRVPTNYDPDTRSYSGVWDGSFKWAYTNNPAWVFYDIVLAERFGLGLRIDSTQVDKWELYRIGQYCDQLVPDGRGGSGTEPRFICDVYIQSQAEAFTVLRDLAAIFRGMTYWGNNQLCALADMPRDVDYIFTRANVIDGRFTYGGGSEKKRYTTAMISWSDPSNNFQDAIEAVSDNDLVRRYGINQIDMTAIGCIRQTEANRRGRWALLTNSKDRIVNFNVGLDGAIPLPGHIIGIADEMLSGRKTGGRISAVSGRNITLDRIADVNAGDRLLVNLPSGVSQARTVQSVNEEVVTVSVAYSETPVAESIWSVDADDLAIQQYRVTGISDNDDNTYSISGVQHDPDKYERIDTGARIDERPISVIPPGVQPPPTNVVIDSFSALSQGLAVTTLRVTWEPAASAIAYEAEWRRDNGNWISAPRTSAQGFQVEGIYAGQYQARVRAINPSDISSIWANAQETILNGKEGNPPMPVGFAATGILFGITLNWGYPEGAEDALKTEIEYSLSADGTDALLLSDVPHPQRNYTMQGLRAGQVLWFRARIVDKSGNQSPWIDWVRGMSSTDTSAILEAIGDDFISNTVAGQQLLNDDFMNAEAILETANANNASVRQQWEQYGENKAEILELWTTQANDARAFAEYQLLVTATFEEQTAAIDQKMTAVVDADGASATYSLRAGLNYNGQFVSAGMVIGAEFINGVAKASIGFNADSFILLSGPEGNKFSPWAVVNGQTFINDAFIQDGSVTNLKIGQYIMSNDYVMGMLGWKIDKDGNAEFNNVTVRGTVYATAGTFSGRIESNDGYFGGTVFANKLMGDIALSTYVSYSTPQMSANTKYKIMAFDSSNFARDFTLLGTIRARAGIHARMNIYVNNAVVYYREWPQDIAGELVVSNPTFVIPESVTGGTDTIYVSMSNVSAGSVFAAVSAQAIITRRGNGITVGG